MMRAIANYLTMLLVLWGGYAGAGEVAARDVGVAGGRMLVDLLDESAGSPRQPDNLKVCVQLPQKWQAEEFADSDLRFFIYPRNLSAREGLAPRYRASGVMLWRQGATVYADLRQPPLQDGEGEYTLLTVLVRKGVVALSAYASRPVHYQAEDVDVALVVDSSQSMARNDPQKQRLAAARAFVETAARDGRISSVGLVRFNDEAKVLCPPTALAKKDLLLKELAKVRSEGLTNIGRALQTTSELFEERKGRRGAVVLLTDGKNESVPYADEHMVFAAEKIPVYCIGLSKDADMALLERIAAATGGRAFRAADHRGLMAIYQRIAAEIGRRQLIFTRSTEEPEAIFPVPVDDQVRNISFSVDAGPLEAELALTPPEDGPSGSEVSAGKNAGEVASEYSSEGYRELRISNPRPGIWLAHVRRVGGTGPVSLTVSGDTPLFLDVFPVQDGPEGNRIGATLAKRAQAVTGGNVLVLPSGALGQTQLYDDGRHGDGAADDGIYAGTLAPGATGPARLLLLASREGKGEFVRQADAGEAFLSLVVRPAQDSAEEEKRAASGSAGKREGGIREDVKPVEAASLSGEGLDFGSLMPGETAKGVLHLQYRGQPGFLSLRCGEMKNEGQLALANPGLLLTVDGKVNPGTLQIPVNFTVPADARGGIYAGEALAGVNDARATIPVRVRIVPVALQLGALKLDLGYLRGSEPLRFSVPLTLQADKALPVRVECAAKDVVLTVPQLQATPGQAQVMQLNLRPAEGLAPGEHEVTLTFVAGPVRRQMDVRYVIPEKGHAASSALLGHELGMLLPGNLQRYALQMHEMKFPAETVMAPNYIPVTPAPQSQPLVVAIPDESVRWREAGLILLAAFVLAALALLLRKLARNRMLRFALLSLSLHLPLIAFVVSYMLLTSQTKLPEKQEQFTAALVASSAEDETGPGVPEKSLLGGAPVKEEQVSRFRDRMPEPVSQAKTEAIPVTRPEPVKTELTRRVLTESLPQPNEPEILPERMDPLERPEAVAEMEKTRPQPVRRQLPVPQVAMTVPAVKPAPQMVTAGQVRNQAVRMQMQPEKKEGRVTAAKTETPDLALAGELPEEAMRNGGSMVARQVREPAPVRRQTPERTPGGILDGASPDRMQDLPKQSELPLAGASGKEARSLGAAVEIREREVVTGATTGQEELRTPGIREDRQTMAELTANPEKEALSRVAAENQRQNTHRPESRQEQATAPQRAVPVTAGVALEKNEFASAQAGDGRTVTDGMRHAAAEERLASVMQTRWAEQKQPATAVLPAVPAKIAGEQSTLDDLQASRAGGKVPAAGRRQQPATRFSDGNVQPATPAVARMQPEEFVRASENGGRVRGALVAEQERFGGGEYHTMAAPTGPAVRVERAEISFREGLRRPLLPSRAEAGGISRTAGNDGSANVGGATAGSVELTAGVVGEVPAGLFGLVNGPLPVQGVAAELTPESLARCQVVVVATPRALANEELAALGGYLAGGGKVWFCGRPVPPTLQGEGEIVKYNPGHPIYSVCYNLRDSLNYAEGLQKDGICAVATGVGQMKALPAAAANALALLMGNVSQQDDGLQTAVGIGASAQAVNSGDMVDGASGIAAVNESRAPGRQRLWQDFSGLADGKHGWAVESWSDPARLGLADDGQGGSALLAALQPGGKGKTALSYLIPDYDGRRMDVSAWGGVRADLFYAGNSVATLSLLLTTCDKALGWDDYLTQEVTLKPGWNRDLSFSLRNLKSRQTCGKFSSPLYGAEQCAKVTLLLRGASGNVLVDNLRWTE